jgi:hypothetical protein
MRAPESPVGAPTAPEPPEPTTDAPVPWWSWWSVGRRVDPKFVGDVVALGSRIDYGPQRHV